MTDMQAKRTLQMVWIDIIPHIVIKMNDRSAHSMDRDCAMREEF